jgi:hypothetical protein
MSGEAQLSSKYRCLQRCLSVFRFSGQIYFEVVWGLCGCESEVYLSLDRTEWTAEAVENAWGVGTGFDVKHSV